MCETSHVHSPTKQESEYETESQRVRPAPLVGVTEGSSPKQVLSATNQNSSGVKNKSELDLTLNFSAFNLVSGVVDWNIPSGAQPSGVIQPYMWPLSSGGLPLSPYPVLLLFYSLFSCLNNL